jgi:hypothetical protein
MTIIRRTAGESPSLPLSSPILAALVAASGSGSAELLQLKLPNKKFANNLIQEEGGNCTERGTKLAENEC